MEGSNLTEFVLEVVTTHDNFNENAYLSSNPDVSAAVATGTLKSGFEHFELWGKQEQRRIRLRGGDDFKLLKESKRARICRMLKPDLDAIVHDDCLDFLTEELRSKFDIIDTDAVGSNPYDSYALGLIEKHKDGIILDCGAGRRPVYHSNVVNFEIAAYDTTDVRGVGEVLPFADNSFDAVFSIAVLEHVKDPFACAREIVRVLKPGGDLMCCVPFLQPVHAHPNHYYNMTAQGLQNLFEREIEVKQHLVYESLLPIHTLTWFAQSWAAGLTDTAREEFLNLKVSDLMGSAYEFLGRPFVTELSVEKNFELACATVMFGQKRADVC